MLDLNETRRFDAKVWKGQIDYTRAAISCSMLVVAGLMWAGIAMLVKAQF